MPTAFDGSPGGCSSRDSATGDAASSGADQFPTNARDDHTGIGTPVSAPATSPGPVRTS